MENRPKFEDKMKIKQLFSNIADDVNMYLNVASPSMFCPQLNRLKPFNVLSVEEHKPDHSDSLVDLFKGREMQLV